MSRQNSATADEDRLLLNITPSSEFPDGDPRTPTRRVSTSREMKDNILNVFKQLLVCVCH
jgi:hypothetical protein